MLPRDWSERPIAHRGLHERDNGVVENTASAFAAAIEGGYGIECDLQEAACGEPMVFHDATLDRLTVESGPVRRFDAARLKSARFKDVSDRMPTLAELLDQAGGRTPLFLEIKGTREGAARFCARIARVLSGYSGPVAVMSFEPAMVAEFRALAPAIPRGLVSCRHRSEDWPEFGRGERLARTLLAPAVVAKPDFIAYHLQSLPASAPWVWRRMLRRPMIVWTVKSREEAARALAHGDGIVFEGFRP
jgi:glycerophosphoryl diester phosphodiesterase